MKQSGTGTLEAPEENIVNVEREEAASTQNAKLDSAHPIKVSISPLPGPREKSRQDLIVKMFEKYKSYRTLEKVASEFGYTRERIRQYLVLGNSLGLIDYKPFNRENFKQLCQTLTREKLAKLLNDLGTVRRVAEQEGVTVAQLNRLLKIFGIEVSTHRKTFLKREILKEYQDLVQSLEGRHPSTYDLLSIKNGRNIWAKISRTWGSYQKFREEQAIPLVRKTRRKRKAAA